MYSYVVICRIPLVSIKEESVQCSGNGAPAAVLPCMIHSFMYGDGGYLNKHVAHN
jgi:hypothetical protein